MQELSILLYKAQNNQMEKEHQPFPNKIEISQFGAVFLKQLPHQITCTNAIVDDQKQNRTASNLKIRRRGLGISFQQFANHTQIMIHNEINTLFRAKTQASEITESKRKQILHHNNWINEQKLIKHKLTDAQVRMEQAKFSEYDWKKQRQSLIKIKDDILNDWETTNLTRQKRMRNKLRGLMDKKYPKKSESGLIRLSLKKSVK